MSKIRSNLTYVTLTIASQIKPELCMKRQKGRKRSHFMVKPFFLLIERDFFIIIQLDFLLLFLKT